MDWEFPSNDSLVRYFESENVWAKEWERSSDDDAHVFAPQNGKLLQLPIYEASFAGLRKKFAADEVSNGIWVFAIPCSNSTLHTDAEAR